MYRVWWWNFSWSSLYKHSHNALYIALETPGKLWVQHPLLVLQLFPHPHLFSSISKWGGDTFTSEVFIKSFQSLQLVKPLCYLPFVFISSDGKYVMKLQGQVAWTSLERTVSNSGAQRGPWEAAHSLARSAEWMPAPPPNPEEEKMNEQTKQWELLTSSFYPDHLLAMEIKNRSELTFTLAVNILSVHLNFWLIKL